MKLKQYQADTLDILRRFLEEARIARPESAYQTITTTQEQAERLGRYRTDYAPLEGLPNTPYVCLRLPTGGGKTILAAHAIGVARDAWIEKDHPLVLWLVPSNTIRLQTVEALRNTRHPYRQALDEDFDGQVRVFDITDFTSIRPHDIRDNLCVVVGTIQTLRVNHTEGRKVYAHNENMEPHFSTIGKNTPGLEQIGGAQSASRQSVGNPRFSFANLLHVHRPLMIVDEAHNAVTGLSRDMQARVNPCAIVEFTATPRLNSNILHSVSAAELKEADMIKLPIMLAEHDSWQTAVNGAIASRAALAEAAKGEIDYIRPIVLFQAQPGNQEVTTEVLKRHLVAVEQIPEDRIAIATGNQRELDGIDLFDANCRIEYVITIEALKEGWDCSFAYVFCSVSRIQSATDVEQLLGRVLRMPYAQRRRAEPLNRAFAHVSEPSFGAAAAALVDKLVAMGFDERDAACAIARQGHLDDTGLFAPGARPLPVFRHTLPASPDLIATLQAAGANGEISFALTGDTVAIVVSGRVAPELATSISAAIPAAARQGFAEAVEDYRVTVRDRLSPAEQGESFRMPRLIAQVQGNFEFADIELFMEPHDWSLASHPLRLDEAAFAIRQTARSFEIDVAGDHVAYQFAHEDEQLSLDVDVDGWSPENLALWLTRQLRQDYTSHGDLLRWVTDALGHLVGARQIAVAALMRTKFILARALRERVAAIYEGEQRAVFQRYLFSPTACVQTTLDNGFLFREGIYANVTLQPAGRWQPRKHFLGAAGLPALDGVEGGDETECAQAIDSLEEVSFWLRNVARHPQSFWLPTAKGKFYPDFVARLNDGRLMVIEYKGALLAGAGVGDTDEKRAVGRLWEQTSGGLFVMVERQILGRDMRRQLQYKLGI